MANDFQKKCLNDICLSITDGVHNTVIDDPDGEYFLLSCKNIKNGRINIGKNERKINKNTYDRLTKRTKTSKDDILITTVGTIGEMAIIKDSNPNYDFQRSVGIIKPDPSKVVPAFLYYALKDEMAQINSLVKGAVQKCLFIGDIKNIVVKCPSIPNQKKIAAVLSSIDNKIEINEKMNQNLEEQIHCLFKSWFVDCEPFNGKMPSDWSIIKLGSICNCSLGGTPSRKNESYWNGDIPWINSGEVNNFRILDASEYITKNGLDHSSTKLLPKKTVALAITGATLGQVSLLEIDTCANQSVIGVIPNEIVKYEYLYPLICFKIPELISHQTGGAQQHINNDNVKGLEVVLPSSKIMKEFSDITNPLYKQISLNCFESKKLIEMRNALLPNLMSGEIDTSKVKIEE